MNNNTLSSWPPFFAHAIEAQNGFKQRIGAIGGSSAPFRKIDRSNPDGSSGQILNHVVGFRDWKARLTRAIESSAWGAARDEPGHATESEKSLRYYALGEQVKTLWLAIRSGSIPTLTAFLVEISSVSTIIPRSFASFPDNFFHLSPE